MATQETRWSIPTRRQFLQGAVVTTLGGGFALAARINPAAASTPGLPEAVETCGGSPDYILNLAYAVEHCAMALYYTALTSPDLLHSPLLAGASGDPHAVGPDGNARNCANLQAALDQEQKHARILAALGATSPYTRFYFPAITFQHMGYMSLPGTFLWALDHLETAAIAGYLTAVKQLGLQGRPDLAAMCVRNLAVECEHRALYRVIARDDPANNVTLPVTEFPCLADAATFFTPYATGHGFPAGAGVIRAYEIPEPARIGQVVGRYRSS